MIKIINGVRYDAEKATEIASYQSPHYSSDFHSYSEILYLSPKSKWFMYGEGNAMSPYSKLYTDGRGPGKNIFAMSDSEVKEWLELHNMNDVYIKYFDAEDA